MILCGKNYPEIECGDGTLPCILQILMNSFYEIDSELGHKFDKTRLIPGRTYNRSMKCTFNIPLNHNVI